MLGGERTRSNATGYASRTDGTACSTFSTKYQYESNVGSSDAADYAITKSTGEGGTKTGQITDGLLQMPRYTHAARLPSRWQATVGHHQTSNDVKNENVPAQA